MDIRPTRRFLLQLAFIVSCCYVICHFPFPKLLNHHKSSTVNVEDFLPFKNNVIKIALYKQCNLNDNSSHSIENLYDRILHWKQSSSSTCRAFYDQFTRIFSIHQVSGEIVIPSTFKVKLRNTYHLSDSMIESLHHQVITKVFNRLTYESNMFNPLRDKRPSVDTSANDKKYVQKIVRESEAACDFCNYSRFTAYDVFGRIETEHSFTAANAFKYDGWHTLVIYRKHHPLYWTQQVFLDGFSTALQWFHKVHEIDGDYIYPVAVWDLMPRASASQIHPHIHLSVMKHWYYGDLERWRRVNFDYQRSNPGRNYFSDLLAVHSSLGLTVSYGSASAFASITPKRDFEIVVLSSGPGPDFFTLLYYVVRTYIDKMDKYCFSLAMALPPMKNEKEFDDSMPAFVRIVPRGSVSDMKSDASSMVLFAGPDVHANPYQAVSLLKQLIREQNQ